MFILYCCLVMLLCQLSPVLWWQSLITIIRCWSAFLQSSWTDFRPSSTQQLVWSVMLWNQITLHLYWKTYTGYEFRKRSSTSYVSLRSSVNIVWHHPTCPTNFNKSLEWSPDSVWDRVRQRSSYHILEGRHWVTGRFLSLPPGRGTVCHQQSLLRQPYIHSVEPWKGWKLIYSPHLSHHLSYIVCILS